MTLDDHIPIADYSWYFGGVKGMESFIEECNMFINEKEKDKE